MTPRTDANKSTIRSCPPLIIAPWRTCVPLYSSSCLWQPDPHPEDLPPGCICLPKSDTSPRFASLPTSTRSRAPTSAALPSQKGSQVLLQQLCRDRRPRPVHGLATALQPPTQSISRRVVPQGKRNPPPPRHPAAPPRLFVLSRPVGEYFAPLTLYTKSAHVLASEPRPSASVFRRPTNAPPLGE